MVKLQFGNINDIASTRGRRPGKRKKRAHKMFYSDCWYIATNLDLIQCKIDIESYNKEIPLKDNIWLCKRAKDMQAAPLVTRLTCVKNKIHFHYD